MTGKPCGDQKLKMPQGKKMYTWRIYALGAGGYDESMDRYGTTGQMPARRYQSYRRREGTHPALHVFL